MTNAVAAVAAYLLVGLGHAWSVNVFESRAALNVANHWRAVMFVLRIFGWPFTLYL